MAMKVLLFITGFHFLAVGAKLPVFLFAGQSNMIGRPDKVRFNRTMAILLNSKRSDTVVRTALVNHLMALETFPETSRSVYAVDARRLLRLKSQGRLNHTIQEPLDEVTCSFSELFFYVDYRKKPRANGIVRASNAKLSPYAGCGNIFGPELMFGHTLHSSFPDKPFRIVKIAGGGTLIKEHWSKESGTIWPELVENLNEKINTTTEEWRGIVWFHGENDSLNSTTADLYLSELNKFIADLRQEMYQISPSSFAQPSDIPVIIVGLGCGWTVSNPRRKRFGRTVLDAQQKFAATLANNAAFVPTDDLVCHLHHDDASMLLIGRRVGRVALQRFSLA